ncbi:MAG: FAD-dependent monooxygenase [Methylobacteriaceae bacterium]|nr:FAD-dependent monooxygenase [Methylobacteriaceae bacterium]
MKELPIIIAGAGIAGLSAALAVARTGRRALVLEKAPRVSEAGAGIQLSPNATRHLRRWGVAARLRGAALAPRAVIIRRARDGAVLARLPLDEAEKRWGAPYLVAHRADLQRALADAVAEVEEIELRSGVGVAGFSADEEKVAVGAKHGLIRLRFDGAALIGADGLWSEVRQRLNIAGDSPPRAAHRTAWRATIPVSDLPKQFAAPQVNLWLGKRAHVVHYPLRRGTCVNVVAIVEDPAAGGENPDFWNEPRDPALLQRAFARWHGTARDLLAASADWRTWPLFDRTPLAHWSAGRVTLAGDAAHPMLPFLAQGAAQAIEDAAALERALSSDNDIAAAFATYQAARSARAARLQAAARKQGDIYHMGQPAAFARDLVMRGLGPQRMLARQDWIYDYRE